MTFPKEWPEAFTSKIAVQGECWIWTAWKRAEYGGIRVKQRAWRSHRYGLELIGRHVPDDLTVDHLCKTKLCVRPEHLDVVPMRENVLRGDGPTAQNARKSICQKGHALKPRSEGGRVCPICKASKDALLKSTPEYRAKERERKRRARAARMEG